MTPFRTVQLISYDRPVEHETLIFPKLDDSVLRLRVELILQRRDEAGQDEE